MKGFREERSMDKKIPMENHPSGLQGNITLEDSGIHSDDFVTDCSILSILIKGRLCDQLESWIGSANTEQQRLFVSMIDDSVGRSVIEVFLRAFANINSFRDACYPSLLGVLSQVYAKARKDRYMMNLLLCPAVSIVSNWAEMIVDTAVHYIDVFVLRISEDDIEPIREKLRLVKLPPSHDDSLCAAQKIALHYLTWIVINNDDYYSEFVAPYIF